MEPTRQFVTDLKPGQGIDSVFLVRDKDLRTTKAGSLYIACTLCDKTGCLQARMWQASESIFQGIPAEGFLQVKGRVEDYKGVLQVIIDACRPVPAESVNLTDYTATSRRDPDAMWGELLEILRAVKNRHLRRLIKKFAEDRQFVAAFQRAPAAMQMHHPFVGGLLEHTLNVARSAEAILPLYPDLNADLVLTGVFMHDMGKAAELTGGPAFAYTDRGQLIGHISIAAMWAAEKADAIAEEDGEPFPAKTLMLLQHIILSHHGEYGFGSPKLPAIPEAYFIHYLDNLDAKMYMTLKGIEQDHDPASDFTAYNRELETKIYKHSGRLE